MRICEPAIPQEFKSPSYTQLHDQMWRNYSAEPPTVCQRARDANVTWSVVSPVGGLIPRGRWGEGGADAFAANVDCAKVVRSVTDEIRDSMHKSQLNAKQCTDTVA